MISGFRKSGDLPPWRRSQRLRRTGVKGLSDFGFDPSTSKLQFTGNVNNYSVEEQDLLNPLIEMINNEDNIELIYERTVPTQYQHNQLPDGTVVDIKTLDETGGEGTFTDPNPNVNGGKNITVVIDPRENAIFRSGDEEVTYYFDKNGNRTRIREDAALDANNRPIVAVKGTEPMFGQMSKFKRTFHGIGHAFGNGSSFPKADKRKAIDLENAASKIHKEIKNRGGKIIEKSKPSKTRGYDRAHQ